MRRSIYAMLCLIAGMCLLAWSFPRGQVLYWPVSSVVTDKNGAPMTGFLSSSDEWSLPIPLSKMGYWMPKVIVALEDKNFRSHSGIYLPSLVRAAIQNVSAGKIISGGSTISSQVIRISMPRARTLPNKLLEFWRAFILEQLLTKDGILEIYLNRAPFGANIRGVEAASRAWFNKSADFLSLGEATLLAGLLRGPSFYRPDRYPERARELRNRLIDQLVEEKAVTSRDAEAAKKEPVPGVRYPIPSRSRIASQRVLMQKEVRPDRFGRVRSTIDLKLQDIVEGELFSSLESMPDGITASAVLAENSTGAVRAYVGNAREGSGGRGSWVDCAVAPRSPGSALKPFVYAAAFERGLITPGTMLADTPVKEGHYSPRNYDRMFRGPVTAKEALAASLNVPAIRVLRAVGEADTLDLYRRLGFAHFKDAPQIYGDNLVLGGCEVTSFELSSAYCTLANNGRKTELVFSEGTKVKGSEFVIMPAAAFLTIDILKDKGRLMPLYREIFKDEMRQIAFKTGTSFGQRDAWTASVTKKYTLVVWFGDPSGRPHRELIGLETAAKAAIRIMRKADASAGEWFKAPSNVGKRSVCTLSGAIPNSLCPRTREDYYIKDISSSEPCRIHTGVLGHTELRWPPELENFFASIRGASGHLKITSLTDGTVYITSPGRDRLSLEAEGGKGQTYWFIDGHYIGATERSSALFWTMSPGAHTISAGDGSGAKDSVSITVKEKTHEKESLPLLEEM